MSTSAVRKSSRNETSSIIDAPELAIIHYISLSDYLGSITQKELISGVSPQRQSARQKLSRLSSSQFEELSTDVYDEMERRVKHAQEVPFLPLQSSLHQKRNQARQKLATLNENRFKDLASDVVSELRRRYPALVSHVSLKEESVRNSAIATGGGPQKKTTEDTAPKLAENKVESSGISDPSPQNNSSQRMMQSSNQFEVDHQGPNNHPPIDDKQQNSYQKNTSATSSGDIGLEPLKSDKLQKSSEKQEKDGKNLLSIVNFSSLDSLMADLGDMIANELGNNGSNDQDSPKEHERLRTGDKSSLKNGDAVTSDDGLVSDGSISGAAAAMHSDVATFPANALSDTNDTTGNNIGKFKRSSHDIEQIVAAETQKLREKFEEDLHKARVEFKNQIEEYREKISEVERELSELQVEYEANEKKLEEYKIKMAELDDSKLKDETTIQSLRDQISKLTKQNNTLETDRSEAILEREKMGEKLDQVNIELEALKLSSQGNDSVVKKSSKDAISSTIDLLDLNDPSLCWEDENGSYKTPYLESILPFMFKASIRDMLESIDSKNLSGVLFSVKKAVLVVRKFGVVIDSYQTDHMPLGTNKTQEELMESLPEDKRMELETLVLLKSQLFQHVAELVNLSKQFAASTESDLSVLQEKIKNGVKELVLDVVGVVQLIRISLPTESDLQQEFQSSSQSGSNSTSLSRAQSRDHKVSEPVKKEEAPAEKIHQDPIPEENLNGDHLKDYLEAQTHEIVQNIQSLLQSMRQPSNEEQENNAAIGIISESIGNITHVVKNIIDVAQKSIEGDSNEVLREKSDEIHGILASLKKSNNQFQELGDSFIQQSRTTSAQGPDSTQKKPKKQKLAASAYQVAKYANQLVKILAGDGSDHQELS